MPSVRAASATSGPVVGSATVTLRVPHPTPAMRTLASVTARMVWVSLPAWPVYQITTDSPIMDAKVSVDSRSNRIRVVHVRYKIMLLSFWQVVTATPRAPLTFSVT